MRVFLLIIVFLFSQSDLSYAGDRITKNYLALGFLDHKTGGSLIGYAKTFISSKDNDVFIGAGTLIAAFTLSLGWKYYLINKPISVYSVLAVQGISAFSGGFIAPFISIGIEKEIFDKIFINIGVNSTVRVYKKRSTELVNFPNVNINYRY